VGETGAARDLILSLAEEYGHSHDILLTNVTRGGHEYARAQLGDRVRLEYLPYDLPWSMGRFVERHRPELALLVESEIWPNMLRQLKARGVPVAIVNGRMSAKSARRFAKWGALSRPLFGSIRRAGAVSRANAARFRFLGVPEVSVTGNLKFDRAPDPESAAAGRRFRENLPEPLRGFGLLLIASTRPGEEEALLEHLPAAKAQGKLLAVVPRHPERAGEVADLLRRRGYTPALRSRWPDGDEANGVTALVGDTLGEMPFYCAMADAVVVCGSFLPYGGQNPYEPMMLGKPVVVGPHHRNFSQFVAESRRRGGIRIAADARQAVDYALELAGDPAAAAQVAEKGRDYAKSLGGAKERSLALIRDLLSSRGTNRPV